MPTAPSGASPIPAIDRMSVAKRNIRRRKKAGALPRSSRLPDGGGDAAARRCFQIDFLQINNPKNNCLFVLPRPNHLPGRNDAVAVARSCDAPSRDKPNHHLAGRLVSATGCRRPTSATGRRSCKACVPGIAVGCNPGNAPYKTGNAPYPTWNVPLQTGNGPFLTWNAPFQTGKTTVPR